MTTGSGRRRPPVRLDGGGQALLEIVGRRFRPRLAAYPGPTLIVNGARDRLMRRHETGFLTSAQRGALLVLPNTGHLTNLEEPGPLQPDRAPVRRLGRLVGPVGTTRLTGRRRPFGATK